MVGVKDGHDVGKDSVEDVLGNDSDIDDNVVIDTVVDDGGSEFLSYVNSKQVHNNITEYHQSAEISFIIESDETHANIILHY